MELDKKYSPERKWSHGAVAELLTKFLHQTNIYEEVRSELYPILFRPNSPHKRTIDNIVDTGFIPITKKWIVLGESRSKIHYEKYLKSLFLLDPSKFTESDILNLFLAQYKLKCASKGIASGRKYDGKIEFWGREREITDRYFDGEAGKPNYDTVVRSLGPDLAVNTYLAYLLSSKKLKIPGKNVPFEFIEDIENLLAPYSIELDSQLLLDRFNFLISDKFISYLNQNGHIKENELTHFFEEASSWMLTLSLKLQKDSPRPNTLILPYTPPRAVELYPSIDFIPYIARTMHNYLTLIPNFVSDNSNLALSDFDYVITDLIKCIERYLSHYLNNLSGRNMRSKIPKVAGEVLTYVPKYENLLSHYRHHIGLINKTQDKGRSGSSVRSYRETLEKIKESGGRTSSKRIRIKMKYFKESIL